jgi:hypothetical protein
MASGSKVMLSPAGIKMSGSIVENMGGLIKHNA